MKNSKTKSTINITQQKYIASCSYACLSLNLACIVQYSYQVQGYITKQRFLVEGCEAMRDDNK